MKARGGMVGMLAVSAVVLGLVGCEAVHSTLGSIGFESRSAQLARQQQQQIGVLNSENAETKSLLVAKQIEADKLKSDLAAAKIALEKEKAGGVKTTSDQKWTLLMGELQKMGLTVTSSKTGKGVRLSSDILFDSGKVTLRSAAKPILSKIAGTVKQLDNDVVIYVDGHTDSDPLRVTKKLFGDNYGLGAARANAVTKELVALGVPKQRLIVRTFGQDFPVAENKTADGKKKNRRVELTFAFASGDSASARVVTPTIHK